MTFRLGDSLPLSIIAKFRSALGIERLEKDQPADYKELVEEQRQLFFENYDKYLDNNQLFKAIPSGRNSQGQIT